MRMWLAVPEAEDGSWIRDPVAADTREEVIKIATHKWSGQLERGAEVVIYRCTGEDILELPKVTSEHLSHTAASG